MQDESQAAVAAGKGRMEAFTFGDPVPVMDRRELLDYLEGWSNGLGYEPPLSWAGLAKSFRASTHHSSAIYFKRNILAKTFKPHRWLSTEVFSRFALDFLVFGNAYLEHQLNRLSGTLGLAHAMAKYTRRGVDLDRYFFVRNGADEHPFKPGRVFHLQEADIERVLDEFATEHEKSAIRNKFTIDTSHATEDETLAQFVEQFEPYLSEPDTRRILTHKARQRGDWI